MGGGDDTDKTLGDSSGASGIREDQFSIKGTDKTSGSA